MFLISNKINFLFLTSFLKLIDLISTYGRGGAWRDRDLNKDRG